MRTRGSTSHITTPTLLKGSSTNDKESLETELDSIKLLISQKDKEIEEKDQAIRALQAEVKRLLAALNALKKNTEGWKNQ
ncbi:hypothetical protein TIFTF001_031246 [Ficus carica]|uniref:Uncharacterized protein n=1 Tax=Ficus carica TaxID=3494 RepID=A0AA88J628_FICCA|nr:hypothetical protein TIFTF001_031246 [Ficus carica]